MDEEVEGTKSEASERRRARGGRQEQIVSFSRRFSQSEKAIAGTRKEERTEGGQGGGLVGCCRNGSLRVRPRMVESGVR